MVPILMIAIGIVVLTLGKRPPVLGAAVGALLGVVLLRLLPGPTDSWIELAVPAALAVAGFFLTGIVSRSMDIVLPVLGALAGVAIVMAVFDRYEIYSGALYWLLVVVGGVAGWLLARRFKEMALLVLAGLIGGILVMRGLRPWFPSLQSELGPLLVIVLAGASVAYQGGFFGRRKPVAQAKAASQSLPNPPAETLPPVQSVAEGGSQSTGDNQSIPTATN